MSKRPYQAFLEKHHGIHPSELAKMFRKENPEWPLTDESIRKVFSQYYYRKQATSEPVITPETSKEKSSWEEEKEKAAFSATTITRITNLDELLAFCKPDMTIWEVEKWKCSTSQMGSVPRAIGGDKNGWSRDSNKVVVTTLYHVNATFARIKAGSVSKVLNNLEERFSKYAVPVFKYHKPSEQGQYAAILNIYDAHIDKLAYLGEVSLDDNLRVFRNLFDRILSSAVPYNPEMIVIPVGNDFFHTNGPENRTKKAGHMLDVNAHHEKSMELGVETLCKSIDKASQVAPVKVILVKANHSEDKDFYLGQVLKAFYRNNPNVEVDCETHQRKYTQYGNCMWAFAHGDKEKGKTAQLPLMMAVEEKYMWAATSHRTFYLGDIHHKQEFQFLRTKDYPGVDVRFLRSVGTEDRWHVDFGYIGVPKTAECHVWHRSDGMVATFLANR